MLVEIRERFHEMSDEVSAAVKGHHYGEAFFCARCGTKMQWLGTEASEVNAACGAWRHAHTAKHKAHDALPLWERIFRGFEP